MTTFLRSTCHSAGESACFCANANAFSAAAASQVTIDVRTSALTVPEELHAVASATGADPLAFVLGGGDDHALLAAFPSDVELPQGWTVIGEVQEPGEASVTVDGEVYDGATGWTHF